MIINLIQQSEYLRKLLLNHNPELTDESIFSYSSDELELFLNDIIIGDSFVSSSDLTFENGELVFLQDSQKSDSDITGILNDFLKNDDIKNVVDVNSDGSLSIEEINSFLEAVEALDSNPEDISMQDIFSAIQSIEDGSFSNDVNLDDKLSTDAEIASMNKENTENAKKRNRLGRTGNIDSLNSSNKPPVDATEDNLDNMSLEQLEGKRTEQENIVKSAQDKVEAAYAGETDAIRSAQANYDLEKQAYEEALLNDESISEEMRANQQANQIEIDNQKTIISDINSNISKKEDEITAQESIISSDESNISALKSSISQLESQTSDDETIQAEINAKLQSAKDKLQIAEEKLIKDEEKLSRLEDEKTDLENNLKEEEDRLESLEINRQAIEANILANCSEATKTALEAFKQAEQNLQTVKSKEIEAAKTEQVDAQTKLEEINSVIDTKEAKEIEREFAVNDLGNVEELYKSMGLNEKGLNFEVFASAIEGYNNLEDKGNGYLGIFDTTQGDNADRYYLLNLNTFELVGQCQLKTGSGNMDNVRTANKQGSHATLSGFERVGSEYYSSSMQKRALRLIGLEEGINDNAMSKGTVVHYTTNNHTWGCKGFPPVKTNGRIDKEATYEFMRKLFPENAIIYTHPTDENYWEMSELYA